MDRINGIELLSEYWVLLVPLIIIQLLLAAIALIHVLRHPDYRIGNKTIWIFVVLLVQFVGPILYFTFGRGED